MIKSSVQKKGRYTTVETIGGNLANEWLRHSYLIRE